MLVPFYGVRLDRQHTVEFAGWGRGGGVLYLLAGFLASLDKGTNRSTHAEKTHLSMLTSAEDLVMTSVHSPAPKVRHKSVTKSQSALFL